MVLIGTAGHVDHGKSTLVEALTGFNPMHLPEEKKREMTIELGFAHLLHPGGYALGIVDVPGHEKLVKTMISGASGFQLALWVVDAREGLMPQSIEHLDILELLGEAKVIPVVTKADLADAAQIEETVQAIAGQLRRVSLESLPIQIVDSLSKRGIAELKDAIFSACSAAVSDPKKLEAPCYMPIDRCFVLKGVGPVVTGTLVRGNLREGDFVSISSIDGTWRIRTLHNHYANVESITAGQRAGVQLHGLKLDQVQRGDVLVSAKYPYRTKRINAELKMLEGAPFQWKPGMRALFLAGSFEMECRLWDFVPQGSGGFVQIQLPGEVCFYRGQRFILRSTNPLTTIGGGAVKDLVPDRLRRITEAERAAYRIGVQNAGGLGTYLEARRPAVFDLASLQTKWMRTATELSKEIESNPVLQSAGSLVWHSKLDVTATAKLKEWISEAQTNPREWPFPALADALKVRAEFLKSYLEALLQSEEGKDLKPLLQAGPNSLRYDPQRGGMSEAEHRLAGDLLRRLTADGLRPARLAEYCPPGADRKTFDKVAARLVKDGTLVRIDNEFVVETGNWDAFKKQVLQAAVDGFTPSEFGRHFNLSRKYSVPYLEALGRMRLVRRQGDRHVVVRPRN